jgi:TatD DNase family protein
MYFIDTHCHIHDPEFTNKYDTSVEDIIRSAHAVGVKEFVCVGTDVKSSSEAVVFCVDKSYAHASLAVHPHEATHMGRAEIASAISSLRELYALDGPVVAIGECGLDYFYHKEAVTIRRQSELFRAHIELAQELDLPMIFHIRDAFEDFFRIIDGYDGVRGVVHSFSATTKELEGVVERGLYLGLNGIVTFTKDPKQLEAAKSAPIENIVLETDAPFLTPKPFRGTMCEPKHVINITQFLSELRGESPEFLAEQTTKNAQKLFNLKRM